MTSADEEEEPRKRASFKGKNKVPGRGGRGSKSYLIAS